MFFIIYKTTCLINNKFYIGMHKTNDISDDYLGSGKYLKRSVRKYGRKNFKKEVLFVFNNELDMKNKEKEIVTEDLLKDPLCMNLTCGGHGGFYYVNNNGIRTDQMRRDAGKKLGLVHKRRMEEDVKYKKIYSDRLKDILVEKWKSLEYREKMFKYINRKGKEHSEETKKKIGLAASISQMGEKNSQYGTCWVTKDGTNKKIKREELERFIQEGWIRGRQCLRSRSR